MIGIVVSRADEASASIGARLLELADWTVHEADPHDEYGGGRVYRTDGFELREFDDLHLSLDDVSGAFSNPVLVVFVSRHAGDSGPLLTGHFTGNFGDAAYGGDDGELAVAAPNALWHLVRSLDRHAPAGYDVGIECTHHGPSAVGVPSLFAELGSGPDQWGDDEAARAVARSVLELRGVEPRHERTIVGFGGGHYAPRFERIIRETQWRVGHVGADWSLDAMDDPTDPTVIVQAFERSEADLSLIDGERPDLESCIEALGYRCVSETWLRETATVPSWVVRAVEGRLSSVDEGLRFGEQVDVDPDEIVVVDLPSQLLDEVQGIDAERCRSVVERVTVAFETSEGGTRVDGRVALVGEGASDRLVDALVDVLQVKYDDVRRVGDVVEATRRAFDPELARELGVPEGPAFGRLASGSSVTVDGIEVAPDQVRTTRVERFDASRR